MRSGSHHMLIGLNDADGLQEGPSSSCEGFGSLGSVPGSQTPSRDFLESDMGAEDHGLGRFLPENAMAEFQLHYVNTTEEPRLREAWINLYKKAESEVTEKLNSIFLVGDLSVNVAPHTRQVTHLEFTPTLPDEPTRVFEITGHSHAHNERFSVWRTRDGQRELLYESYDWAEPMVVRYNTVVENPAPNPDAFLDGGMSGLQYVENGDTLEWECEVNNTTDAPLRFANEAYTAEMCLLGGVYVGDQSGQLAGGCAGGSSFQFGSGVIQLPGR
jgi:hypothetical protein